MVGLLRKNKCIQIFGASQSSISPRSTNSIRILGRSFQLHYILVTSTNQNESKGRPCVGIMLIPWLHFWGKIGVFSSLSCLSTPHTDDLPSVVVSLLKPSTTGIYAGHLLINQNKSKRRDHVGINPSRRFDFWAIVDNVSSLNHFPTLPGYDAMSMDPTWGLGWGPGRTLAYQPKQNVRKTVSGDKTDYTVAILRKWSKLYMPHLPMNCAQTRSYIRRTVLSIWMVPR